jgi:uracil-DNA glycosylase
MGNATISRVRMRDLARLGRSRTGARPASGPPAAACASRRQVVTEAASIGNALSPHPRRPARTPNRRSHGITHRGLKASAFVEELARARIGTTFNQYAGSRLRRARLEAYLNRRAEARYLLVGEAAGYRGARVSGLPFTSERQLSGEGPAEATATIVHRVLAELGLEEDVLLWNVVPTHPHQAGEPRSNRRPTKPEVFEAMSFLDQLAAGRRTIGVGRLAHSVLGGPYVRHPSHGGSALFRTGLLLSIRSR